MKILHLGAFDVHGGAARAAYRQHEALLEAGADSSYLVWVKDSNAPHVHRYSPETALWSKTRRLIRRLQIKVTDIATGSPHITSDKSVFCDQLLDWYTPDIVNIHQVHGFVDIHHFFRSYAEKLPIVNTMHDMWSFTGGCHYSGSCQRYRESCGQCPLLGGKRESDATRAIWRRKRAAYDYNDRLAFVADSNWLAERARESSLLRGKRVDVIHYGINTNVYHARARSSARAAIGIDQGERVVLFAAANAGARRKGFLEFRQAVEQTPELRDALFISMGRGQVQLNEGYRHQHLGAVDDPTLQSVVYRAADVFVMPSLQEAFGQTALEAVVCGTPVVAFNTGGLVDIIEPGRNGALIPVGNVLELGSGIVKILEDGRMRERWIASAAGWAEQRFSYRSNAGKYLELYRDLTVTEHV